MSSGHSETEALCQQYLQRLASIRKGDEGAVDSAATTQAARARLDTAMADFSTTLATFSHQGTEAIQQVRLAASLLDRQLQDELQAFRRRKWKDIHILHAKEEDHELLRTLKVLLLERKLDAGQDLILQAAVRLALKLIDGWPKETFNELSQDRRLTKGSEESRSSRIVVRFQCENITALHRLEWLLRRKGAGNVHDGIVLQTALQMVPIDGQLATEVVNVLDRGGGKWPEHVLVRDTEDRRISFYPTAKDERVINNLRDADQRLTGVSNSAIVGAAVALLELPNDEFLDHARELTAARSVKNKGVHDKEDRRGKKIQVWMTSERLSQFLALKPFLLRAGIDATAADILRAAIRCVPSGATLASKVDAQKQSDIQEHRQQGQRTGPSGATQLTRLRRK
jgi:hypothetical protein